VLKNIVITGETMRQIAENILKERKAKVLHAVIHQFIKTGKPVGSNILESEYDFDLSPATLRSLMAELEKDGYLTHPHTSAGRIPTDAGYRAYVNSIVELQRLAVEEEEKIRKEYEKKTKEIDTLLSQTSRILSGLSNYTGFVLAPKVENNEIRNIELVQVAKDQILVVLLTKTGDVKNKLVNISIDAEDLEELKKFLNRKLRGLSLSEAGKRIFGEIQKYETKQKNMIGFAECISEVIDSIRDDIYMDGASNVLAVPDFKDLESARYLMQLNEDRDKLKKMIGRDLNNKIQVRIGAEHKDLSVITTSYNYGNRVVGVLGIIGPKRMEYEKMIALVNSVSTIVNGYLSGIGEDEDDE